MSKPNLLGFASSLGIYRNFRVRELHDFLQKNIPIKVNFADLAPMLFQVVMAYAGENQIDGNFEGYSNERWAEIFITNHVQVSPKQAALIHKGLQDVGLFDGQKIRSWMKFNRHLADYDSIVKAKRRAGKILQQKRAQEARQSLKKSEHSPAETAQNRSENGSASKQLWLLEKALENAKGPARKELLAKKRALLEGATGTDLSAPPPPSSPAPRKAHKPTSPGEFERTLLKSARGLVQDNPELLTEGMVRALVNAGDELPPEVRSRFRKLLEQHEKEAGNNPVPG